MKVRLLKQKWHNTNSHNNIRDKKFYTENHHHRRSSHFRKFKKQNQSFTTTISLSPDEETFSSSMETNRFKRMIRYDYIKNMFGLDKSRKIGKNENGNDNENSIRLGLLSRTLRACALGNGRRSKSVTSNFNLNPNGQLEINGVRESSAKNKFDYNSATVPTSRLTGFTSYSEHFNSIKDTFRNLKKKVFIYKGY